MAIQQISVFVENKQGKLVQTVQLLAANNINIRAMSIADTKDFGILRMITSDNAKTKEVLSNCRVPRRRRGAGAEADGRQRPAVAQRRGYSEFISQIQKKEAGAPQRAPVFFRESLLFIGG